MTVSSTTNRKEYAGNAVTTSFATSPVVFFSTSDLTVYVVTESTGAVVTLTENTHYTVSGGSGSTGTVNTAGGSTPYGAPASGETLVIVRNLSLVQAVDLVNNDSLDAEVIENEFDKLTMMIQQLSIRLDRSFVLADSDTSGASTTLPTPSATKLIGWDDAGTALQNYAVATITGGTVVSAFVDTLLDDADGNAFVATLFASANHDTFLATVLTNAATDAVVKYIHDNGTAEISPAINDVIPVYDTSVTNGRTMALSDVLKVVNGLTEDTSPATNADYILSYDASATASKKILLGRAASPSQGTAVASTAGAAIDFTAIPSWAKKITISLSGVSTTGTSNPLIQIGDSGGIETSGYLGAGGSFNNANVTTCTNFTTGFGLNSGSASNILHGSIVLTLVDSASNLWSAIGVLALSNTTNMLNIAGTKALSATLDRVRITTVGGTDTFDAGTINIQYA